MQQDFGYTAIWAELSPGSMATMVVVFVAGYLSLRPHPKYLIAIGAGALSTYRVTIIYGCACFWHLAEARMFTGNWLALHLPADHLGFR